MKISSQKQFQIAHFNVGHPVHNLISILVNTIATVAVPFFNSDDAEETPEARARRQRNIDMIKDQVLTGIRFVADKYAS